MVALTKTAYGFKCVATAMAVADLPAHQAEFDRMHPAAGKFGYVSDQRACGTQTPPAQKMTTDIVSVLIGRGLERQAVVSSAAVAAMQIKRLVGGTPKYIFVIDGNDPLWEAKAARVSNADARPTALKDLLALARLSAVAITPSGRLPRDIGHPRSRIQHRRRDPAVLTCGAAWCPSDPAGGGAARRR